MLPPMPPPQRPPPPARFGSGRWPYSHPTSSMTGRSCLKRVARNPTMTVSKASKMSHLIHGPNSCACTPVERRVACARTHRHTEAGTGKSCSTTLRATGAGAHLEKVYNRLPNAVPQLQQPGGVGDAWCFDHGAGFNACRWIEGRALNWRCCGTQRGVGQVGLMVCANLAASPGCLHTRFVCVVQ